MKKKLSNQFLPYIMLNNCINLLTTLSKQGLWKSMVIDFTN
jgi:hypothetical protein